MAFRRQDIPKTTRKTDDGGPRRIYPRYLRDQTILPKIELAIGYLDRMIGHKRGELASETMLDYFGDPKLARCLLACLGEHYVYRTQEFTDVIGAEAAAALLKWEITAPSELRGYLYQAANAGRGGYVTPAEREAFLPETGDVLGLSAAQIEELIHLDAERNALLIRIGPQPHAEDVVERYNVMLTLSVLRHAASVALDLPGLSRETIAAVCTRHELPYSVAENLQVDLTGRRNALGTWSGYGARIARCVVQLLLLAPNQPTGEARVHFGERAFKFVIDAKCTWHLRPTLRAVAGIDEMSQAAEWADLLGQIRKERDDLAGWRIRRMPDPVVVDGAVLLPELAFSYGQVNVAAIPVSDGSDGARNIATLRTVNQVRPVIALGPNARHTDIPTAARDDPAELVALLSEIAATADTESDVLDHVEHALEETGWLSIYRLRELFPGRSDLGLSVAPLVAHGADYIANFGLCSGAFLEDLRAGFATGPIEIAALRRSLMSRFGEVAGIDALTLHVLGSSFVMPVTAAVMDRAA